MNENGTRPPQPQADQTGVQADGSPAPLIVTRLRVPRRRSDLLPRRRLVDFIHTHLDRRLILVSAPAGYGKTTLLTESWLRGRCRPCPTCLCWWRAGRRPA